MGYPEFGMGYPEFGMEYPEFGMGYPELVSQVVSRIRDVVRNFIMGPSRIRDGVGDSGSPSRNVQRSNRLLEFKFKFNHIVTNTTRLKVQIAEGMDLTRYSSRDRP